MPLIMVDPRRFQDKPLHLVPCIIAGEAAEGDYSVLCDGWHVGRITRMQKAFGRVAWDWTVTGPIMPPEMGNGNGSAESKEDAKAALRTVFDRWRVYFGAQGGDAVWLE